MPSLRAVEERDGKGNVIRVNPTIVFKQDRQIRKVRGRHDWDLLDNPNYHEPISAQVQGKDILFFEGTPESTSSRAHAKLITKADVERVAPYIITNLKQNPIKVREARPMVYEVKLANIGGEELPVTEEHDTNGAEAITVEPVAPKLTRAPVVQV